MRCSRVGGPTQERLNLSYAPTTWWPRQGANKLTDIGETAAVMIQEAAR